MKKYKDIFDKLQHPIWIKDEDENKIIFINSNFKQILGMSKEDLEENILKYVNNIKKEKDTSYKFINKNNVNYNSFVHKNKVYKYSISTIEENSKIFTVGTIMDVSDLVDIEGNFILKTIMDNVPSIIFYKDKDFRYMGINKPCEKFYADYGVHDIIGKNDLELPLDKEFIKTCNEHDKIVYDSKEPLYLEETVFSPSENKLKTFQTVKTPIIDSNGEFAGIVGVVRDVTEYKLNEEKLRTLSYTDPLTSLYNRLYFDKVIDNLIENESYPVGVVFGDVNGLKLVNDTFGHHEGDKFLLEVTKCLKKCCNENQTLFRWSGDEFCILLPNYTNKECLEFIEKINECCKNTSYKNFGISISLGFSILEKGGEIDEILAEAEGKVYKQKMLDTKSIRVSTLNNLKEDLQKKNVETEAHTERVVKYCHEIAKVMELPEETMDELELVATLHDIGKIGIPDEILLKPTKLSDSEFEIMKTHSEKGYRLALLLPEFSHISRAILTHHERWDGNGYPLEIKGEEIPLISRIVSVVDSYDAMTNDRVYSKAKSKQEAIKELKNCSGKQFDPKIVEIFCEIIQNKE